MAIADRLDDRFGVISADTVVSPNWSFESECCESETAGPSGGSGVASGNVTVDELLIDGAGAGADSDTVIELVLV